MSNIVSELGDLAGGAVETTLAFGIGFALGAALEPASIALRQGAWSDFPIRAVDVGDAASIVAEDVERQAWGEGEAKQSGFDADRFDALVRDVLRAPGMGELIRMYRRGTITTDQLAHGFRKAKLETQYDDALTDLQHERIDPSVVATSIQRGIMHDPGFLPAVLDFTGADVPEPAVSDLDAVKEAEASGISADRLAVYTRIVGLPPAPGELLQLLNRGDINEASFRMGIAEGNTRNEWADKLMLLRRRLLTPREYAEAELRGVLTTAASMAGAGMSGLEPADYTTLFNTVGRPLNVHAITTGLARGGTYGGTYDDIPEPYRDAVRRSNIRPEYARLAHANRYTIPSYFILRAILQDGGMTEQDFAQYGKDLGWPPELADKAAAAIAGGATGKADAHVTKADNQLWTTAHKAYVDQRNTRAEIEPALTLLGVATDSQPAVIERWTKERELIRAGLSPTEIRKAIGQPGRDKAWAETRLRELGWTQQDAEAFLAE